MWSRYICFSFLLYFLGAVSSQKYKTTPEYLAELNYKSEEHRVVTEDGYVLTIFRIPNEGGTPILFMHGFLACSDYWFLMDKREENIATILADKGYDIWLANQRGNTYSRRHKYLSTDSSNYEYWKFSGREIGTKDIPASVDYILSKTGRKKLFYIGHSMGTTVLLILCSVMPKFCRQKLDAALLLAPIVYAPEQVTNKGFKAGIEYRNIGINALREAMSFELMGRTQLITRFTYNSCLYNPKSEICMNVVTLLDYDKNKTLPRNTAETLAMNLLAGTSLNVVQQLGNIFDPKGSYFGDIQPWSPNIPNSLRKRSNPVIYNLKNITVPIALYWSDDDMFLSKQAMEKLQSNLNSVILNQQMPTPPFFGHLGYFASVKENYEILVGSILNVLKLYDSGKYSFLSYLFMYFQTSLIQTTICVD